ncbi:hypothetical protein K469DRAFT_708958 [Zopfia rhizophila CBS 207.26]|uniref:Uncharacterized protein n=1 Tax=Zopfia rhizophila CBS 207.26 TaxID=1314779 RepID=A0A6A6DZN7_9PEZI|nr:hypothetical protein K469DRAFT_708958 [Zopfia rhizophila CBS 207.26]
MEIWRAAAECIRILSSPPGTHVSKELNLNSNLLLRVLSSGYINNQLSIDYIYYFNKYTKLSRRRERWRILIFNSHLLRFTYDFISFCWGQRI